MIGSAGFAEAVSAADGVLERGAVGAVTTLRAAGIPAEVASAAVTQASLRRDAVRKFGADAASMYFTRTGLEQATRAPVAAARAARLAGAGARRIADLGCGIGADSRAFARAGLAVEAVEADPATADVARANLRDFADARVTTATAEGFDLSTVDAAFCDPARRTAGGRRVFSPAGLTPSWEYAVGLFERVPHTVLKLAPGLSHDLIPPGVEAEWVSVDGDLVEAALWSRSLATVPRRATVFRGTARHTLTGTGDVAAPPGEVRPYLFDPDGAVTRSGLVAEFASTVDGVLADPSIAFVYADRAAVTPFARCLAVVEQVPIQVKRMRAAVRAHGIGRLEIRKRGSAVDVEQLRRDLRLAGLAAGVLVLTWVAGKRAALLCRDVA